MSYVKTTWTNGEGQPVDADNLNKIEAGIAEAHENISTISTDITNIKKALGDISSEDEEEGEDGGDGVAEIGLREEVTDIRTGYNGTVYESAGAAVRGQVESLHNNKVGLPMDGEGNVINGRIGQFAVSDGTGGVTWLTIVDGNEVDY